MKKEMNVMDLQVLVATMNQQDHVLLDKMNINSAAIIGNQCDRNEVENFCYKDYPISYLSFKEIGVGLNRNNTLMRATSEIILFSDDDVILADNYRKVIVDTFNQHRDADVILFDLDEGDISHFSIKKCKRIRYFNYMRYGTPRIACRRESITRNGITFNLHFGGGAQYGAGEDTLFLHSCLKKRLKILAVPVSIGTLEKIRESTWFKGYDDRYFFDKGALFSAISPRLAKLLCLQFAIRKRKLYREEKNVFEAYKLMKEGASQYYGGN